MDPKATWQQIVSLAVDVNNSTGLEWEKAEELAELVLDLRDWFNRGGFVPSDWHV